MTYVLINVAPCVAVAQRDASFTLDWQAPVGCPGETQVVEQVLSLAGPSPTTSRHRLEATGNINAAGGQWWLALRTQLDGVEGERTLNAASCDALTQAAALTMALMLNPGAGLGTEPDVEAWDDGSKQEAPTSAPPLEVGIRLAPAVGLTTGVLPRLGAEAGVGAGVYLERAALWFDARVGVPQTASVATTSAEAGGRMLPLSLRAIACYAVLGDSLRLWPCGGAGVTWLSGQGTRVAEPRADSLSWMTLDGALAVELSVGSATWLWARSSVSWSLARPRFFVENVGEVHRVSAAQGRAEVGAMFAIW